MTNAMAVMQISSGGSTISRTFTLHCHYVELYTGVCPSNMH